MSPIRLRLERVAAPAPVGPVLLASGRGTLVALDFGEPDGQLLRLLRARFGPDVELHEVESVTGPAAGVRAYFAGDLKALDAIPIDGGGTAFQRRVWAALRAIPAGETRSYGQIAANINQPSAARAVGLANGQNPINLVVPCHRVIGGSGALTGYGGGLDRKQWLLAHERAAREPTLPFCYPPSNGLHAGSDA